MSIGPVQICNLALYKIGEKQKITAWPDDSVNGRICYQFFDNVRDETLEFEDWKCARASARLAVLSASPAISGEYEYQYGLPNDCILPRIVCDENGLKFAVPWDIEGRNLLTNEDAVYLKYTFRQIDLNKWTPTLLNVFVLKMAIALVVPIGKNRSILSDLGVELTKIAIPNAEISNARVGYVADEEGEDLAVEAGR